MKEGSWKSDHRRVDSVLAVYSHRDCKWSLNSIINFDATILLYISTSEELTQLIRLVCITPEAIMMMLARQGMNSSWLVHLLFRF